MVVDEVQTGFGRTGKLAIEHYGIEPDLITVAKSIAMGLPLSGVIGKAEIMDAPGDSAIGGTYVGNPSRRRARGARRDRGGEPLCPRDGPRRHDARGWSWKERFPRSATFAAFDMLAIELVRDLGTQERTQNTATAIVEEAVRNGLLLLKSGIYSNCIRVLAHADHRRRARRGARRVGAGVGRNAVLRLS